MYIPKFVLAKPSERELKKENKNIVKDQKQNCMLQHHDCAVDILSDKLILAFFLQENFKVVRIKNETH